MLGMEEAEEEEEEEEKRVGGRGGVGGGGKFIQSKCSCDVDVRPGRKGVAFRMGGLVGGWVSGVGGWLTSARVCACFEMTSKCRHLLDHLTQLFRRL